MTAKLGELFKDMQITIVEGDEAQAPVEHCETCDDLGYVRYDLPVEHPQFGKLFPCPNPQCPARAAQEKERFSKLNMRARLPSEYAALSFADWDALIREYPEYMIGKWRGYGAARAFVAAAGKRFYYSNIEATAQAMRDIKAARAVAPADKRRHYPDAPEEKDLGVKNSLVLSGINGVGKTSLAMAIAHELLAQNIPVLYARTREYIAALTERFNSNRNHHMTDYEYDWGETTEAIVSTFQNFPVLILDEFGFAQYSPYYVDMVEQLVRFRYNNQKPTIFTTNLGYEELASEEKWNRATGHAVHGMAHWFTMGGLELRRRNGAIEAW